MTEAIAARFARDTAERTMVVLHDQGLYRHLRFRKPAPNSWHCWFDLITAPGVLMFWGDGESFAFSRTDDMFAWFRGSAYRGEPNPGYWAQKLTDDPKRTMRFSEERFRQWVQERVAERDDLPGLAAAVQREVFDEWDGSFEVSARDALHRFRYVEPDRDLLPNLNAAGDWDFEFDPPDPGGFDDYYWWFLWACHAIVWGIAQYDASKAAAVAS